MEIIYWNERVKKFINGLDRLTRFRAIGAVDLLEEKGHLLDMPDSKSLGKGLFELRTQGKIKVRILYIFHMNRAYILHGFVKKMWKINPRDIDYTRKLQREVSELA